MHNIKKILRYMPRDRQRRIAALVFVIILILLSGVIIVRHQVTKTTPDDSSQVYLRSQLIQNNLLFDSAQFIDGSLPTTGFEHQQIHKELSANIASIKDHLGAAPDEATRETIAKMLEDQSSNIEHHRLAIETLSKALSYNPVDDIESLDPAQNKEQVVGRAQATSEALQNLRKKATTQNELITSPNRVKLSEPSVEMIQNTSKCYDDLSNNKAIAENCTRSYEIMRKELNKDLLATLLGPNYEENQKNFDSIINNLPES